MNIHEINASLYDICPHCGASKPITSSCCLLCFVTNLADEIESQETDR